MKVLMAIGTFFPSQQGGPCNSVYAVAKALAGAGASVDVLTTNFDISPSHGIPKEQWVDLGGFRAFYMDFSTPKSALVRNMALLANPWRVTRIMDSTRYDLVHSTMLFTGVPHVAAFYGRQCGKPVLWSPRGALLPYRMARGLLKKKLYLSMPTVRTSLHNCYFHATSEEEVAAVSAHRRGYSGEMTDDRIYCIPNLAEDGVFRVSKAPSPYPFPYVLYLGRIHPLKRIEVAIEALSGISVGTDLKLVVAGWSGEHPRYTARLRRQVISLGLSERVVFTERRVEGEEKTALYRNAELFVLPSESENFGMVVLESLAQGGAAAVSRQIPWQTMAERNSGYCIDMNVETLRRTIERHLSKSVDERRVMQENALKTADGFTRKALTVRYSAMYEDILKKYGNV